MLSSESKVLLLGDRFYGQANLITYCHRHGWDYRLRLKGNLKVFTEDGAESPAKEFVPSTTGTKEVYLENVFLTEQRVPTNISILQEPGHEEPWILATGSNPNYYTTLDYGMRWGCEAMFSDFKTRGFGLEDTQLERTDRVARLLLILSVALHWCVFTGLSDRLENPLPREKKTEELGFDDFENKDELKDTLPAVVKKTWRSACSFFKRGLRVLRKYAQKLKRIPPVFFMQMKSDGW